MKKDKAVIYWLLSGCVLVFIMVVVGGITRLTHSGLSISNYKLISGTIPPIGEAQWQEAFEMKKEDYIRSKQIDWFYIPGGEPNFLGPIEVEDGEEVVKAIDNNFTRLRLSLKTILSSYFGHYKHISLQF